MFILESCGEPPEMDYASVNYNATLIGDEAEYTCDSGYRFLGGMNSQFVRCEAEDAGPAAWSSPTEYCVGKWKILQCYSNLINII